MLSYYLEPVKIATILFVLLAVLLLIPVLVYQYRKYGVLVRWRGVVFYSFIFYMMAAYFLIILPLPTLEEVANMTGPTMNLVPFQFVSDFVRETVLHPTDTSTFLPALRQGVVLQPIFNILLTLPFGVYMRYAFKRNLGQTIVLTILLSLFFEITQLTGLYGAYPRPYRLFDVDDMMLNTLGGAIGYWFTPYLSKLFPQEKKIEALIHDPSRHRVTYLRRMVAFIFDWLIFHMLLSLFQFGFSFSDTQAAHLLASVPISYTIIAALYFLLLPWLANGQTVGKRIVKIRIVGEGGPLTFRSLLLRQFLLYGCNIPLIVYYLPAALTQTGTAPDSTVYMYVFLSIALSIATLVFFIHILASVLRKKDRLVYETISSTQQVSLN